MTSHPDQLLCHRCGYCATTAGETQCPRDGLHLITRAAHDQAPRDAFLGATLGGRYPILGLIGAGGMGAVYRSVQPLVDRPVAIKVILPTSATRPAEARQRFLREARAIAALTHPCIVTLHEFGAEPDGTLFMVMEYVRGRTLAELYRSNALTARQLVALGISVLDALQEAHRLLIIHRDLKPANIIVPDEQHSILGPGLQAKVLDFGLAKVLDEARGVDISGSHIPGTPRYIAPEQAAGHPVDHRSDLYSFSVLLYEGLAGRCPFEAEHPLELIALRFQQDPAPLPDRPDLPEALRRVIMQGLARDPARRFSSAREMALQLAAVPWTAAADQPLLRDPEPRPTTRPSPFLPAPPDWTASRPADPRPVRRWLRRTALGGLLLLLAGGAYAVAARWLPWPPWLHITDSVGVADRGVADAPRATPEELGGAQDLGPAADRDGPTAELEWDLGRPDATDGSAADLDCSPRKPDLRLPKPPPPKPKDAGPLPVELL